MKKQWTYLGVTFSGVKKSSGVRKWKVDLSARCQKQWVSLEVTFSGNKNTKCPTKDAHCHRHCRKSTICVSQEWSRTILASKTYYGQVFKIDPFMNFFTETVFQSLRFSQNPCTLKTMMQNQKAATKFYISEAMIAHKACLKVNCGTSCVQFNSVKSWLCHGSWTKINQSKFKWHHAKVCADLTSWLLTTSRVTSLKSLQLWCHFSKD